MRVSRGPRRRGPRPSRPPRVVDPRPWFRCPFGAGADDPRVLAAVMRLGLPARRLARRRGGLGAGPRRAASSRPTSSARHPGPRRRDRDPAPRLAASARSTRCRRLSPASATPAPTSSGSTSSTRSRPARTGREPASGPRAEAPAVLAVDGGNSKTDVALLSRDGRLLAAVRGPTTSHQQVGLDVGIRTAASRWFARPDGAAGLRRRPARRGRVLHAGRRRHSRRRPAPDRGPRGAPGSHARRSSSTMRSPRSGPARTAAGAVGVICGAGVNAAGIAPDGRTARLDRARRHLG